MSWRSVYAIYRPRAGGSLVEVFRTDDMKKAKYWISYIGKVGDALCKTPLHPKHPDKNGVPEYWTHKQDAGSTSVRVEDWKLLVQAVGGTIQFPNEQAPELEEVSAPA
jgi:hypothetical protein